MAQISCITFVQMWAFGLLGCVLGWGSWKASRRFAARYTAKGVVPSEWTAGMRNTLLLSLATVLTMAALGVYAGWRADGPGEALSVLISAGLLLTITLVDLSVHRIPNVMCLTLVAWSLVHVVWLGRPTLVAAASGLAVAGVLFLIIALSRSGAMGIGDVKLAAAGGALLGYPLILRGLFWGILAGGCAALLLLASRRITRKSHIAYGPYLALGISIALVNSWGF